jgi:hypothetical protein
MFLCVFTAENVEEKKQKKLLRGITWIKRLKD